MASNVTYPVLLRKVNPLTLQNLVISGEDPAFKYFRAYMSVDDPLITDASNGLALNPSIIWWMGSASASLRKLIFIPSAFEILIRPEPERIMAIERDCQDITSLSPRLYFGTDGIPGNALEVNQSLTVINRFKCIFRLESSQ